MFFVFFLRDDLSKFVAQPSGAELREGPHHHNTTESRGRQRTEVVRVGLGGAFISAKQMAHRDIPVVFHHINFTLALPLFQQRDGEKKSVCVCACECGWVARGGVGDTEGWRGRR